MTTTPPGDLPRRIGFWGGSAIMVGIIIGSGIFQVPPEIAKRMGSPALILGLWFLGGVLSLFGAFAYAELATLFPRSGGPYVYIHEGLGKPAAFTFGWAFMLLIKPFAAGAITLTFATQFDVLFGLDWNPPAVACAMIVLLTALNAVTLRGSSAFAIVLTSLKILALVAIVALGIGLRKGTAANFAPVAPPTSFLAAFAPVMYGILWTYDGWADVSAVSGEVENPSRQLPRILLAGTAAIILIYLGVNAVYISLVPLPEMKDVDSVAPLVMDRLLGKASATGVTAIIVISTLGATHAAILTGARITFAQARDGLLFRFLGRIHPKHETPAVSLWIQAATACAAVLLLRRFQDLAEGYGFSIWIFHALVVISLMRLRAKRPDLDRPYKCWGYPAIPVVFIGVSILMTVLYMVANPPARTLPWLGVMLLGFPVYWLWNRATGKISTP